MKHLLTALKRAVTPPSHDGAMTTSTTPVAPQQLTLLPEPTVPLRFRLDEATRRRGLRHIAEIRAQLQQSPAARPTPFSLPASSADRSAA